MSGTNKLVQSENAMKGGSEQELTKGLENANSVAISALKGTMKGTMQSTMKK